MESTFPVRKRLRDFAGVLNEELGDGAESTVLQGDDSDRYVSDRHLNWQELDVGALGRKSQYGRRKHCEKVPGCHEAEPNLGGRGDNSHPRVVASAGAKRFHFNRSNHAFGRWQSPRFIHQIGKRDLAPSGPRTLRARCDNQWIIKKEFIAESFVCERAESSCDQKVDLALAKVTMQRLRISGREMKREARMAPRQTTDDGRHIVRSQKWVASDPHLASRRIGEKFHTLHAQAEIIEYGHSTIE